LQCIELLVAITPEKINHKIESLSNEQFNEKNIFISNSIRIKYMNDKSRYNNICLQKKHLRTFIDALRIFELNKHGITIIVIQIIRAISLFDNVANISFISSRAEGDVLTFA